MKYGRQYGILKDNIKFMKNNIEILKVTKGNSYILTHFALIFVCEFSVIDYISIIDGKLNDTSIVLILFS